MYAISLVFCGTFWVILVKLYWIQAQVMENSILMAPGLKNHNHIGFDQLLKAQCT